MDENIDKIFFLESHFTAWVRCKLSYVVHLRFCTGGFERSSFVLWRTYVMIG